MPRVQEPRKYSLEPHFKKVRELLRSGNLLDNIRIMQITNLQEGPAILLEFGGKLKEAKKIARKAGKLIHNQEFDFGGETIHPSYPTRGRLLVDSNPFFAAADDVKLRNIAVFARQHGKDIV